MDTTKTPGPMDPRKLAEGVIAQAKKDLEMPGADRQFRAAWRWITSRRIAGPFSFTACCEALGADVSRTRQAMIAPHREKVIARLLAA